MDWSRRTLTFAAVTSCILLGVHFGTAFGQDPDGSTRSIDQPWMVNCETRSCVSMEQAAGAFFRSVLTINETVPPGGTPRSAFGLSKTSWDALVAHARAWAEDDLSYQAKLTKELCSRASAITSGAQLAAALEDDERLAEQHRATYVDNLDSLLTPGELDSVIQEIDDQRNSMGWADIDWALYFELENVDVASTLARLCEA